MESADQFRFSVLTLNCWGIPLISKNRAERMTAIGEALVKSKYDVCVLQELWSHNDYDKLVKMMAKSHPFAHYFHSGVTGSGVCVFSKHPIQDVLISRYSLNGYAHKPQHGDWFGGKLVGLCSLKVNNLLVHVYASHVHAEYARDNDEYLAHRVAQILELCQFVRYTRQNADITILAGDMNVEPVDLGYRMLIHHGQFNDAWVSQREKKELNDKAGHTNEVSDNVYSTPGEVSKRIDYIFYSSSAHSKYMVKCDECSVVMENIEGKALSYSDHKGVAAIFDILPRDDEEIGKDLPPLDHGLREEVWDDSLQVFNTGLKKIIQDQKSFCILIAVALLLECIVLTNDFPYGTQSLIYVVRLAIIVGIAACSWMAGIMCRAERNGMFSAIENINILKVATASKKES